MAGKPQHRAAGLSILGLVFLGAAAIHPAFAIGGLLALDMSVGESQNISRGPK